MHPMLKELFIDSDANDLAAEQDQRRRARRSRRARPAMIVRAAARHRDNRPRPRPATRRPQPRQGGLARTALWRASWQCGLGNPARPWHESLVPLSETAFSRGRVASGQLDLSG